MRRSIKSKLICIHEYVGFCGAVAGDGNFILFLSAMALVGASAKSVIYLICVKNQIDGNGDAGTVYDDGDATGIKSTPHGQTVTSLNDDNSIEWKWFHS